MKCCLLSAFFLLLYSTGNLFTSVMMRNHGNGSKSKVQVMPGIRLQIKMSIRGDVYWDAEQEQNGGKGGSLNHFFL